MRGSADLLKQEAKMAPAHDHSVFGDTHIQKAPRIFDVSIEVLASGPILRLSPFVECASLRNRTWNASSRIWQLLLLLNRGQTDSRKAPPVPLDQSDGMVSRISPLSTLPRRFLGAAFRECLPFLAQRRKKGGEGQGRTGGRREDPFPRFLFQAEACPGQQPWPPSLL